MISVAEASEQTLRRIQPLPGESISTENAVGRMLVERVVAPRTSPPFDNASMDGYAVRQSDLTVGMELDVIETVRAGTFPSRSLASGEAMRVMTGAPIPPGADSVIRHEDTDNGRQRVRINDVRDAGRNVRQAGEDFSEGDLLFESGEELRVPHLGVLASAGVKRVNVHRMPRVAIISSGDELVELGDFQPDALKPTIISSNSVTLPALVRHAGGEPVNLGIARDTKSAIREKLQAAADFDLIVTSAGLSVGDHDHVRTVFEELGGAIDFWKVRMRPGAPVAFGMLAAKPWIGLSGNPVSAIVTFELFVRPIIRRMLGFGELFRPTVAVTISERLVLAAPLMHFLRAVIRENSDGEYTAELAGSQSSAVLTALARSNALLIVPGDRLQYEAGERFRALPLSDDGVFSSRLELT